MNLDRSKLPYRPTSDCFLMYKNKIVAQDKGYYLAFPGGGVDPGEDPDFSAKREIDEEIGGVLVNDDIKILGKIKWDWHPEWANTNKRKKRYQEFRGEIVYFYYGIVKEFNKPSSVEDDDWKGELLMNIDDTIKVAEKYANNSRENEANYKMAQLMMLRTLKQGIKYGKLIEKNKK